jgi:hypothetical protein
MTILAQADLTASTNNLVASMVGPSTINVLLCNRTNGAVNVSMALVPTGVGAPTVVHWVEYQLPLDANMSLERTGIPLGTGDQVFVNPSGSGVSCSVIGLAI